MTEPLTDADLAEIELEIARWTQHPAQEMGERLVAEVRRLRAVVRAGQRACDDNDGSLANRNPSFEVKEISRALGWVDYVGWTD